MKKITLLITIAIISICTLYAQSPDQFNYQAVLRNADGTIMADESVSVYIEILEETESGTSVFNETHNLTTTDLGLIQISIGSSEDLKVINWASNEYFLKITVNGTEMGTSQLLSVPYALQAKRAGKHYIGELYQGGIIFYIDETGEHGLIASLNDLDGGTGVAWSNIVDQEAGASDIYDGELNTAAMIAQSGHTSSAALLCDNYTNDGYDDWYLPSMKELLKLEENGLTIHNVLDNDGDPDTYSLLATSVEPYSFYWSSTEWGADQANFLYMDFMTGGEFSKADLLRVRAVRKF